MLVETREGQHEEGAAREKQVPEKKKVLQATLTIKNAAKRCTYGQVTMETFYQSFQNIEDESLEKLERRKVISTKKGGNSSGTGRLCSKPMEVDGASEDAANVLSLLSWSQIFLSIDTELGASGGSSLDGRGVCMSCSLSVLESTHVPQMPLSDFFVSAFFEDNLEGSGRVLETNLSMMKKSQLMKMFLHLRRSPSLTTTLTTNSRWNGSQKYPRLRWYLNQMVLCTWSSAFLARKWVTNPTTWAHNGILYGTMAR